MKKLFALLLAIVALLSFASCGEKADDIRGDQTGTPVSSADASSDAAFSAGATNGLTYESKFIGIGCKLNDEWTFYTDEQIRELNNATADLAGDEYKEMLENATVIYDMFASHSNQVDNININLEKVNPLTLATIDLEQNFKNLFSTMEQTLGNIGYTNVQCSTGKVTIDGKDFTCMNIVSELGGMKMYQTSVAIKCNGYLASITISTFGENKVSDILEDFYLI